MGYKEELIKSIPLFQRNSQTTQQYLGVAGEVFDEMQDAIDSIKYSYDYAHVPEEDLDNLSALFDLRYFANLDEYGRRKFAKDAAKLYKKLGTRQALKYIFKIIGIKVFVEQMWMLAPVANLNDITYLYNGTLRYHEADVGQYYNSDGDPSIVAPLQLIDGNTKIYDNGVYVDLHYGSSVFSKWKIYGEEYDEYVDNSKFNMIKVPYYFINITEESYNLYVDTGDPNLNYIDQEKIRLAKLLLDYTLQEYLGANEVVLGTRLMDKNEDNLSEFLLMDDSDFQINLEPKDGNYNRLAAYPALSEEAFGEIVIESFVVAGNIPSEELFGETIVRWNQIITGQEFEVVHDFGDANVINALLYLNGIQEITTEESFEVPVIPTSLMVQSTTSEEAFSTDAAIIGTQFTRPYSIPPDDVVSSDMTISLAIQYIDAVGEISSNELFEIPFAANAGSQLVGTVGDIISEEATETNTIVYNVNAQIMNNVVEITSTETVDTAVKINRIVSLDVDETSVVSIEQISKLTIVENVGSSLIVSSEIASEELFSTDATIA